MACRGEWSRVELGEIQEIMDCVFRELSRATKLHGPFNSTHEGYAIILEELDEAWDDIKANRVKESKQEMTQVAAMCIRYIMDTRTE
jgi:hypothetical protein